MAPSVSEITKTTGAQLKGSATKVDQAAVDAFNQTRRHFHYTDTKATSPVGPDDPYDYQSGFGNSFASEAVPGVLPIGQNSPQNVAFGLYAEQMTGTSFAAPRHVNKRNWLYRVRPAVAHRGYQDGGDLLNNGFLESNFMPNVNKNVDLIPTQLAWRPYDIPTSGSVDFVGGLKTIMGTGDATLREGLAVLIFACNASMDSHKTFVNQDGEMLIVAQHNRLDVRTELGHLWLTPGEICVIPKGLRFNVSLPDGNARGYVVELYGSEFKLPDLGPLGANGLANARDFLTPTADYEVETDQERPYQVIYKLASKLWFSEQGHSPFDVVAWHGNYVPYKYDMTKFVNVGSISVDHIDPSIFTVLTAPSRDPTAPLVDFLVFSPRWDTASNTFRPPYMHRNSSSEMMGLIYGEYDGRSEGFAPGSMSVEVGWTPHGVDYDVFKAATAGDLTNYQISNGSMAFMVETSRLLAITKHAVESDKVHAHEEEMWENLTDNFSKHHVEIQRRVAGGELPASNADAMVARNTAGSTV